MQAASMPFSVKARRFHFSRTFRTAFLLSGTALASGMILLSADPARADCTFGSPAGDTNYICDSGTSAGSLLDTDGNNTLSFPAGGSGEVDGDVTFGDGADGIDMDSGSISGAVDQGDGVDSFDISAGSVLGNVQQGDGEDDFVMTGGEIASLNQGGDLDTFTMSAGHIIGGFDDGDHGVMTGGQIGRVDMKLAKNYFNMSGGTIDGNLVTGLDTDTIILSGGSIGGNISVSSGVDSVTISGGSVGGEVRMGSGADTLSWDGGGTVAGAVILGLDDDKAFLSNLTDENIITSQVTGDLGTDSLTFDNVSASGVTKFDSWESMDLTNGTELTFDSTLVLGDADTGTGSLSVDATSILFGGQANGGISAFAADQFVEVVNSGRIDLTNGGDSTTDTFTIAGNYTGNNGFVSLQTVLGDDASQSDRLVIAGGQATGSTGISIVNVGGTGDETTQNGIMVVEATDGAVTGSDAFGLSDRVAAGAYEYLLFKGGVSDGTEENWYLRSELIPDSGPGPDGGVPLFRIEVPTYSVIAPAAHHLALSMLGPFHERRGEQALLQGGGSLPTSWGRAFGQDTEIKWDGTVAPSFDGDLFGFQAGQDLFGWESDTGHSNRVGLFAGYANMEGGVRGDALALSHVSVGDVQVDGTSLGGYWTHIGPNGGYIDAVLMGTWFGGDAMSNDDVGTDIDGTGITASLEGGYPIALTSQWALEPQAQIIWQSLSFDDQADRFSDVSFDNEDAVTGRLGFRLQGNFQTGTGLFQPYLKANFWHNFEADQVVLFDDDPILTELEGTSVELGGGIVASLGNNLSLFATADYTTNLDGEETQIFEGNIGLSMKW